MAWTSVELISGLFVNDIAGSAVVMGLIVLAFLAFIAIKGNMGIGEVIIVIIAPLIVLSVRLGVLQPTWLAGIVYIGFTAIILLAIWRITQK